MAYYTIEPPPHLKPYVKFYWVLEAEVPFYLHRSIADVYPELLFHYKGYFDEINDNGKRERSFTAGIHGQTDKISWFRIEESFGIFGIYLYPYALQDLFNIPALHFTNKQVDLESVLGKEGKELEERVFLCKNNSERVVLINAYLEGKLHKSKEKENLFKNLMELMVHSSGNLKINELAKKACISERQFERKFISLTGMRPKLFSKIVRFHAAFEKCHVNPKKSLTEIAMQSGYYDQSHFIQDCKTFSGINPKALMSKNADGMDWLNG